MTPKAIQTKYAGCRFRSRTEARWAVFFTAMGWRWEYEKEGFALPSGRYLPDFWLPDLRVWWEVKGEAPSHREQDLLRELTAETGEWAVMCEGQPKSGSPQVVLSRDGESLQFDGSLVSKGNAVRFYDEYIWLEPKMRGDGRKAVRVALLEKAYEAARSARFEHGEQPK